jgi:aryl-alcohol dehydrogenase-like predicted oxidoreductase
MIAAIAREEYSMKLRHLGNSGLRVSQIGLGCNVFGAMESERAKAVIHRAIDLGVTLFDTADFYGGGLSEEFLGRALGARRKDIVVATKFGLAMGSGPYSSGASRRYIMNAVEASLKRLGTDYIDLYQQHFPDEATPIEETLSALDTLVQHGKVRYVGSSNYAGWQIADAAWIAKTRGFAPFVSAQNHYNLLDRRIEREVSPAAKAFGVSILPYFPLASGLLTGKYKRGAPVPNDSRAAANPDAAKRMLTEANFDVVEKLEGFAGERGKSVLDVAVSWLLGQQPVASVISGATKPAQVEANVAAGAWTMPRADLDEVNRITARS